MGSDNKRSKQLRGGNKGAFQGQMIIEGEGHELRVMSNSTLCL